MNAEQPTATAWDIDDNAGLSMAQAHGYELCAFDWTAFGGSIPYTWSVSRVQTKGHRWPLRYGHASTIEEARQTAEKEAAQEAAS